MAGVLTLMIGHWMGLPALYDRDDGGTVVGKWSLMDRGFGNFYGALPGPVDAWSAAKMGWLNPVEAEEDTLPVQARFLPLHLDSLATNYPECYRIPLPGAEEFIVECRCRGSENDTVCYAFDRNGDTIAFYDDYTVKIKPGVRVPVRADNLEFDSPGSGILIWHHDGALDGLIRSGRFNSVENLRGLDLEEADGAQDIGQDYPLLTAGYGTDYGIFEDAWFGDNDAHKAANSDRPVRFDDNSYPNSRSNSGAYSNIRLDLFSRQGAVMSFRFRNDGLIFSRRNLQSHIGEFLLAVGNFDDSPDDQEFAVISDSTCIYDGDGAPLQVIISGQAPMRYVSSNLELPLVRDLNGDGKDEIIYLSTFYDGYQWGDAVYPTVLVSQPVGGYGRVFLDPFTNIFPVIEGFIMGLGEAGVRSKVFIAVSSRSPCRLREYDSSLQLTDSLSFDGELAMAFRLGSDVSDSVLIMTKSAEVYLWHNSELNSLGRLSDDGSIEQNASTPILADFDGSGGQDLFFYRMAPAPRPCLVKDLAVNGLSVRSEFASIPASAYSRPKFPVDFDGDGRFEIIGNAPDNFTIQGVNGLLSESAPRLNNTIENDKWFLGSPPLVNPDELPYRPTFDITAADFDADGDLDYLYLDRAPRSSDDLPFSAPEHYQISARSKSGGMLPGFPIAVDGWEQSSYQIPDSSGRYALIQPDGSGALMLLVVSFRNISLFDPGFSCRWDDVWWQGSLRDRDNSNAVCEPAIPFTPSPSAELMPADLCYNWPNPARGESTAIRFFLNYPAEVTVDIFDIAGDPVATLRCQGQAGVPNEIIWNIKNVARGGYLAVVKAEGSGRREQKTVKIAVVR